MQQQKEDSKIIKLGGKSGTGTASKGYVKKCKRTDVMHVLDVGKARIWAGSGNHVSYAIQDGGVKDHKDEQLRPVSLVINCGGTTCRNYSEPPKSRVLFDKAEVQTMLPGLWDAVKQHVEAQRVPVLTIDWQDGAAPPLTKYGVELLIKDLEQFDGDVLVHCIGGHGRTGTLLSALAHMTGACGDSDPVEWVRENYCEEAVETTAQLDWLRDNGIPTNVKTGKRVYGGGSSWSWDGMSTGKGYETGASKKGFGGYPDATVEKWVEKHAGDESPEVQAEFARLVKWDEASPMSQLLAEAKANVKAGTVILVDPVDGSPLQAGDLVSEEDAMEGVGCNCDACGGAHDETTPVLWRSQFNAYLCEDCVGDPYQALEDVNGLTQAEAAELYNNMMRHGGP